MKKLFITLALACVTLPALAQHHGHGFRHHGHYNHHYRHPGYGNWVAPLIIGGAIGYTLTRPEPVIIQQPVIIEQQPITQNQNCSPWKEVWTSDGKIYRERTCTSQ
jgi:hypothetical protein